MLLFLPAVHMAKSDEIVGAPTWVHEFLERVESRDDVRNEIEDRAHKATLEAINELSGTVGEIAGALARLERKVEAQRHEIRNTRDKMSVLEDSLKNVHDQIDDLTDRVQDLEEQIKTLRESDGETPATATTTEA